jgi:hypothetical protein
MEGTAADRGIWVEHLSEDVCWDRLASCQVGRLGVLVDSAPEVYPVNFVVDGRTIVFRTDPGTKLRALERSPSVCFEVDDADVERRVGWSVLVKGRAEEVTDVDQVERLARLPLAIWGIGDKAHWVRIAALEISGRRVHRGAIDDVSGGAASDGAQAARPSGE